MACRSGWTCPGTARLQREVRRAPALAWRDLARTQALVGRLEARVFRPAPDRDRSSSTTRT
jgi:hypothetical protein